MYIWYTYTNIYICIIIYITYIHYFWLIPRRRCVPMNIMLLHYIIYEINICESLKWYSHRKTTTISLSINSTAYTIYIIYYGRCRGVSKEKGTPKNWSCCARRGKHESWKILWAVEIICDPIPGLASCPANRIQKHVSVTNGILSN